MVIAREVGDRRGANLCQDALDLRAGLGEVDDQRHVLVAGQPRRFDEVLGRDRVRRMRRDRRRDPGMLLPPLDESFRRRRRRREALEIGGREIDQRLSEDGPQAAVGGLLGDRVLEVVHVDERRRAAAQHLPA